MKTGSSLCLGPALHLFIAAILGGAPLSLTHAAAASVRTPACSDCHDVAALLRSSVHGRAEVECASCHTDLADVKEFPHPKPAPVDCTSCHDAPASADHPPACADCHGGHEVQPARELTSSQLGSRLSEMCGTCHEEIVRDYGEGVHGRALKQGNWDVPTCLTCHGGHAIKMTRDPGSPVNAEAQASTCASCHDNNEVARKYGLPPARMQTFRDSFHGLANDYGDREVANCATCHGVHRILPSTDPNSTIAAGNLPATCGRCHPQAGRNFAEGKVHLLDRWEDNPFTYVARRFYRSAIAAMMTVFAVFMAADFTYRRRLRKSRNGGTRP